jgi:hypothetical protein
MIDEKVSTLFKNDKYIFSRPIQIMDGRNVQFGTTNGSKFGNVATFKQDALSFYDATAIAKRSKIIDPVGGINADGESRAAIIAILDLLVAYGLMADS